MTRPAPTSRAERGSASLEAVVLVPVMLLVALLVLQLGVVGWTVTQTEEAARQAARAHSLDRSPHAAAEDALPGALTVEHLDASGDEVTLRVKIPRVSPLPVFRVTRSVTMPDVGTDVGTP